MEIFAKKSSSADRNYLDRSGTPRISKYYVISSSLSKHYPTSRIVTKRQKSEEKGAERKEKKKKEKTRGEEKGGGGEFNARTHANLCESQSSITATYKKADEERKAKKKDKEWTETSVRSIDMAIRTIEIQLTKNYVKKANIKSVR